ncbi:hypothetical protein PG996_006094 [Apiospora saccharicola]|uniref:Swt1-like HEPN domain-containing protein n=1 Tax=Apiospora saccharicola TaxID=335842 RepID=A0ABR1VNB6_9PEZI
MQPTVSSINKVQWWYDESYYEHAYDNDDDSDYWEDCPAPEVAITDTSSTCVEDDQSCGRAPTPVIPVEEQPPPLADRTGLWDYEYENEPSTHVEIESVAVLRVLTEALDIVRGAFYDFCKEHQPSIWRNQFAGGPHEVLLGFSEIEKYLAYWHTDTVPPVSETHIRGSLVGVTDLRNAICHFRPKDWFVHEYDSLIKKAQVAVIGLDDEPRTFKIRALRDELKAIAEETLKEIEEIGIASITPCHRDWKPHHERFFQSLLDGRPTSDRWDRNYQYRPAVLLAFEAWRWQRQRFGADHPLLDGEDDLKGLFD